MNDPLAVVWSLQGSISKQKKNLSSWWLFFFLLYTGNTLLSYPSSLPRSPQHIFSYPVLFGFPCNLLGLTGLVSVRMTVGPCTGAWEIHQWPCSQRNIILLFPSLPIVPHTWILTGLILCRPCAWNIATVSPWEEGAMSCPGDSISQYSLHLTALKFFPPILPWPSLFPEVW